MPEWATILKQAGFPTDVLVLDFECYFDAKYRMPKLSTIEYVADERFEELGLAELRVRADRPDIQPVSSFDHAVEDTLRWAQGEYGQNLEGCTMVAQNAVFDGSILAFRHGIYPPYVVDILGLARHLNPKQPNDLGALADRWGITAKGDTSQFSGYHWDGHLSPPIRVSEPGTAPAVPKGREIVWGETKRWYCLVERRGMSAQMQDDLSRYARNDAEIEWALFQRLLPKLSNPAFELRVMNHTLGLFWKPRIAVDFAEADKALADLNTMLDERLAPCGRTKKEIGGTNSFETLLRQALYPEDPPMKAGKNKLILAIAKHDQGSAYLRKHPRQAVRELMEARTAVKSWPLHINRVKRIVAQAKAAGGLLPVPLKYCGAHTGRWSGGEKINLQNLTSRSNHDVVNRIRCILVAPEGQVLVVADASQIEARVLAWVAGQEDLVDAFASNAPIYCNFASEVLGFAIRKARADDPEPLRKWLTQKRNFGKVGVLGCGYGMGWKRCLEYAKQVYHLTLAPEEAQRVVQVYRSSNRQVCKFWRDVENMFKFVTKYPHETRELPRGLKFWRESDETIIQLPSSRILRYPGAMVVPTDRGSEIRWPDRESYGGWARAWGGLLTENVVQAISRDILAEAMFRAETDGRHIGLKIGHHCHDEMVGVVAEAHGEEALQIEIDALAVRPSWAQDCPLGAEGHISTNYGKG